MTALRRPNLPPHGVVREISRMYKGFLLRLRCEPRCMPIWIGARAGKISHRILDSGRALSTKFSRKHPHRRGFEVA